MRGYCDFFSSHKDQRNHESTKKKFHNFEISSFQLCSYLIEIPFCGKTVGMYTLVYLFNNRWRCCCGRFNFNQRTLKLGYWRVTLYSWIFCNNFGIDFFYDFGLIETKHFLHFHGNLRLLSRQLCRGCTGVRLR